MARKSPPIEVVVKATQMITPNLKRIVFSNEELATYPDNTASLHIKAFIPKEGQTKPVLPEISPEGRPFWENKEDKPYVRAYTVSFFNKENLEIGIDFVLHKKGPASQWAAKAETGDILGLSRPGGPNEMLAPGDSYLLAGDLSALPAMRIILSNIPDDASGAVFIQVPSEEDCIPLDIKSSAISVNWVVEANHKSEALSTKVKDWNWPDNKVSAWVAGESTEVVRIRKYLKTKGLSTKDYYAIPYWKTGETEEKYHAERHVIMDEIT